MPQVTVGERKGETVLLEPDVPRWVAEIFAAVDRGDARRFASFFTEDGQFHFGNAPPVCGRNAVEAAVAGFFGSIRSCAHRLSRFWAAPGGCAMHGVVQYVRHDGREVAVPFANVFVLRGEKIVEYRVYVDLAPLHAN